jgi:hypothetical protein
MLNQFRFISSRFGRCWLAAPLALALALSHAPAHAQVVLRPEAPPKARRAEPIYYVDGKLTTQSKFSKLDQRTISTMRVLTGDAEIKTFGSTTNGGTVVVTTKPKASLPTVVAFNQRINGKVPLTPATAAQDVAITAAATYVTQTYPRATLEGIFVLQTLPASYKALLLEGGKRVSLHFDSTGQPIQR